MFFQESIKVDVRVVRIDVMGTVSVDFGQAGSFGDDDVCSAGKGFQRGNAESFEIRGEDKSLAILHQCLDLSIRQVAGENHIGQLLQYFQCVRDKAGNGLAGNDELLVLVLFGILGNPFEVLSFGETSQRKEICLFLDVRELPKDRFVWLYGFEMIPPVGNDCDTFGFDMVLGGDGLSGEIRDRDDKLAMLGSMAVHHTVIQVDQLVSPACKIFRMQDAVDVVDEDDAWMEQGSEVPEVQGDAMVFPDETGKNDVVPHGKAGAVLLGPDHLDVLVGGDMFGIGWDIQPDLVLLDERIQIRTDLKGVPFDPSQIPATKVSVNDDWFCHQSLANKSRVYNLSFTSASSLEYRLAMITSQRFLKLSKSLVTSELKKVASCMVGS